jgi:hypothetical protein
MNNCINIRIVSLKDVRHILLITFSIITLFIVPYRGSAAVNDFYTNITFPGELDPQLALVGPSKIKVGEPVELHLVALGKNGEPCDLEQLPLIQCEGPRQPNITGRVPGFTVKFKKVATGIYKPERNPILKKAGYYLFTAMDLKGGSHPFGLPIYVDDKKPSTNIYWGDLHGHSTLSDGTHPAEEYYRWARDVARLDMMALTDHNWALDDTKIAMIKKLANEWYEEGKFVPFFAFEWALGKARKPPARGRPDHKHLIFRKVDEELGPWKPSWHDTPTVAKLWEMCEGREVIAIPHHTGLPHDTFFGTDWSQHNEEFERLAEIFSDWGSSEVEGDRYQLPEIENGNFIRDALARGYHIGFAGGSDTHRSRPGLNALPKEGHPYPLTSLTAVESPGLNRDELWLGLYNRRCYVTSAGRRHLLEFTVNGSPMGSRVVQAGKAEPRKLVATIAGSTEIKEVIIVKNSKQVAAFPGKGWLQTIEWVDKEPSTDKEDSYYVRAEMADTSMAWSSPVWVGTRAADPDLSPESRLWRLDGDVMNRKMQIITSGAADVKKNTR